MEPLYDTKQAAEFLNLSQAYLERDRRLGPTIPFVRIGQRAVRYDPDTLKRIVNSRTVSEK